MKLLELLCPPSGNITTITTAESLTAGMVCAEIASESGISAALKGGVCAYNIDIKVKLLGVERAHAETCNCVSETVAKQMAIGARKLFGSDIAVATTGYAEAYPSQGIKTPHAFWAIASGEDILTGKVQGTPTISRQEMRELTTQSLLAALKDYLLKKAT